MNQESAKKIIITSFLISVFHFIPTIIFATNSAQQDSASANNKTDTLISARESYMYIRGIERDAMKGFNPFKPIWKVISYPSKQFTYGIKFATGYGSKLVTDKKFIDTIEDFFFNDDRSFGWYPIFNFASGFRPRFGATFLYKFSKIESMARAKYADEEKYKTELRLSYRFKRDNRIWRLTLSAFASYDDDREFYGIGHQPRTDVRSHFLSDPKFDYGVFFQRLRRLQLVSGVRLHKYWEFYFTSVGMERKIINADENEDHLGASFNIYTLPGSEFYTKQFYNEILVRLDTRDDNKYISSGFKIEGRLGISAGFDNDRSKFMKLGFDLLGSIAAIQQNRILIPRLCFETIENLNSDVPISFTEYPRHPSFRGVSERNILRADNYVLVPSLEYVWPLSFNLGGHLFFDYLIVTDELLRISFHNAPYAVGLGFDFHGINEELERFEIAYGSEGIHVSLNIGWSMH